MPCMAKGIKAKQEMKEKTKYNAQIHLHGNGEPDVFGHHRSRAKKLTRMAHAIIAFHIGTRTGANNK